jgi:hypothetical protein
MGHRKVFRPPAVLLLVIAMFVDRDEVDTCIDITRVKLLYELRS